MHNPTFRIGFTALIFAVLSQISWSGSLPSGYTKLEYIESKGKSWFDTGVPVSKVSGTFDVQATFSITDPCKRTSDAAFPWEVIYRSWLFGAAKSIDYSGDGSGVDMWGPICWNTEWIQPRRASGVAHAGVKPRTDTKYTFRHKYPGGTPGWLTYNGWYYLNGSKLQERGGNSGYAGSISSSGKARTIYMFCCNVNGTAGQHCYARIWDVWIKDGSGNLVFEGIPCRRNSDKKIGMYDTVSSKFFSSASSTSFTAGPDVGGGSDEPTCSHSYVAIGTAKSATCTTKGITAGQKCSKCGYVKEAQKELAALGHDWSSWTITTAATTTSTGLRTRTCKRSGCDATETETIPVVEPDPSGYVWPTDFTQLQYVKATSGQYIDTGVGAKSGFKVDMYASVKAIDSSNNTMILSAYDSSAEAYLISIGSDGKWSAGLGASSDRVSSGTITLNVTNHIVGTLSSGNKYELVVNDSTKISKTFSSAPTSRNLYLMARNYKGTADRKGSAYLYQVKLYDGATKVRDFVPCKVKVSGVVGLYDKVQGKFYKSASSTAFGEGPAGTFTPGSNPTPIEPPPVDPPEEPDEPVTPGHFTTNSLPSGAGYTIKGLGSSGDEVAVVFTNSSKTVSWTVPSDARSFRILAIAGGGGGGKGAGGGGGAGEMLDTTASKFQLTPGATYDIKVGAGGAGYTESSGHGSPLRKGQNGGSSSITKVGSSTPLIKVAGGGGGATYYDINNQIGSDGGSGGGGGYGPLDWNNPGFDMSTCHHDGGKSVRNHKDEGSLGNEGGASQHSQCGGGGGGGAGEKGHSGKIIQSNARVAGGDGGDGAPSDITGVSRYYAAGGGGGGLWLVKKNHAQKGTPGKGGKGGGGDGAGCKSFDNVVYSVPSSGEANTGSGAGGGANGVGTSGADNDSTYCSVDSRHGGSGIVVIRYKTSGSSDPTCAHTTVVPVTTEIEPTCTEAGRTAGRKCASCGKILESSQTIPALGHDIETVSGYPATEEKAGLTDGKHCKRCDTWTVPQVVIPRIVPMPDDLTWPDDFTSLSYIASSGKQYIDTGVKTCVGIKAELDVAVTQIDTANNTFLLAAYAKNAESYLVGVSSASKWLAGMGSSSDRQENGTITVDERVTVTAQFDSGNAYTLKVGDAMVITKAFTDEPTDSYALYLFARNQSGAADRFAYAKVYGLKIWQGSSLLRDYVPCQVTETGMVGLYDKVTQAFCPSELETPFIPGTGSCVHSHTKAAATAKEPTCTEPGSTAGLMCADCGKVLKPAEPISALGHVETTVKGYPATATQTGLTDGIKCSRCGIWMIPQEIIPTQGTPDEPTTKPVWPRDFTKLEYVETTGEQYINTGVLAAEGVTAEMTIQVTAYDESNNTFALAAYDDDAEAYFVGISKACKWSVGLGKSSERVVSESISQTETNLVVATLGAQGSFVLNVDNEALVCKTFTAAPTAKHTLYLAARNCQGVADRMGSLRIFAAKLSNASGIVRDYVPCKVTATDEVGFYDLADGEFHTSATKTSFVAGPIASTTPSANLPEGYTTLVAIRSASANESYIDTGIAALEGLVAELDFEFQALPSGTASAYILAAYADNHEAYLPGVNASQWYAGLGVSSERVKAGTPQVGVRYATRATIGANNTLTFTVNGQVLVDNKQFSMAPTDKSLYLFARHENKADKFSSITLYGAKLYTNETVLARDYVPCLEDATQKVGLYDKVTGAFVTSDKGFEAVTSAPEEETFEDRFKKATKEQPIVCEIPTQEGTPELGKTLSLGQDARLLGGWNEEEVAERIEIKLPTELKDKMVARAFVEDGQVKVSFAGAPQLGDVDAQIIDVTKGEFSSVVENPTLGFWYQWESTSTLNGGKFVPSGDAIQYTGQPNFAPVAPTLGSCGFYKMRVMSTKPAK